MIKYELYDSYGKKVYEHFEPATNCGTVILEHQNQYYRPITHDLNSNPNVAKCVPVEIISCRGVNNNVQVSEERNED